MSVNHSDDVLTVRHRLACVVIHSVIHTPTSATFSRSMLTHWFISSFSSHHLVTLVFHITIRWISPSFHQLLSSPFGSCTFRCMPLPPLAVWVFLSVTVFCTNWRTVYKGLPVRPLGFPPTSRSFPKTMVIIPAGLLMPNGVHYISAPKRCSPRFWNRSWPSARFPLGTLRFYVCWYLPPKWKSFQNRKPRSTEDHDLRWNLHGLLKQFSGSTLSIPIRFLTSGRKVQISSSDSTSWYRQQRPIGVVIIF